MAKPLSRVQHGACLLAVPILAACAGIAVPQKAFAQTETRSQSRVVPSGEKRQLAFFTSLNPDCTVDGEMTVRIAKQASHGIVDIDRGLGYSAYGRGDQRYACNLSPEEGHRVNYISNGGYVGDDQFEIEVFSPAGRYSLWKYDLTVK
jgi:hypothetical protein